MDSDIESIKAHSLAPISLLQNISSTGQRNTSDHATDQAIYQLSRDPSTSTNQDTDLSSDLLISPATSQTSGSLAEANSTQQSPSSDTKSANRHGAVRIQDLETVETSTLNPEIPEGASERSNRRRKPTQKAADLAADSNSKLFKTMASTSPKKRKRSNGQDTVHQAIPDSLQETSANHLTQSEETNSDTTEENVAAHGAFVTFRYQSGEKTLIHKVEDSSGTSPSRADKATPRALRSTGKISPTDDPIRPRSQSNISQKLPGDQTGRSMRSPSHREVSIDSATPGRRSTRSRFKLWNDTADSTEHSHDSTSLQHDGTQASNTPLNSLHKVLHPPQLASQTIEVLPAPSTSTAELTKSKPKVTLKLKLPPKPPPAISQPNISKSLPCGLKCLDDSSTIYMWATLTVEHEALAEEVCGWPNFENDTGREANELRGRWNKVLAGFCECGACDDLR